MSGATASGEFIDYSPLRNRRRTRAIDEWDMTELCFVLGAFATVVTLLLHLAHRELLSRRVTTRNEDELNADCIAVSVLKPLCGLDANLERNLESMFRQDHPDFEIVLGAADPDDPALDVARRVARNFPHVRSRVVAESRRIGFNPKVNNLANLIRVAHHDAILISDSNVRVPQGYLRDMCRELERPGVGMVTSPIRGVSSGTLGAELEALQLNTFVMGGVGAMTRWFGGVCAVGKSMLLRRTDLGAIGGFRRLARYLAEDQVAGEEIAGLGLRVSVSSLPVDNVLGELSVRDFAARHLRWARIRRWITPAGYAGEVLLRPLPFLLLGALLSGTAAGWAVFAGVWAGMSALHAVAESRLQLRRTWYVYPLHVLLLDCAVVALWPVPFWSRDVVWRGNRFTLGPRTLLEPTTSSWITPATATRAKPADPVRETESTGETVPA